MKNNIRKLSEYEHLLVELVHFLSSGDREHMGLSILEIKRFLEQPIESKDRRNALQCLALEKRRLIKELKDHLESKS